MRTTDRLASAACLIASCLSVAGCEYLTAAGSENAAQTDLVSGTHVDAANGNDVSGTGSSGRPFKSITRALQPSSGNGLILHPGTYDVANGETFPIRFPDDMIVSGAILDTINLVGAIIRGGGAFT